MSYSKTTPPPCQHALERPRIDARLRNLLTQHPAVWVSGPPGAGKSFSAAALARAAAHAMWYSLDERDTGLEVISFYAARAAAPDGAAQRPGTGVRMTGDPREFFYDFYARLEEGTLVVFDNVQHLLDNGSTAILEAAITEIPAKVRVLFLSRRPLPDALVRLEVTGLIGRLRAHELYFDEDEVARCLGRDAGQGDRIGAWLKGLEGWAAGIGMLKNLLLHEVPLAEFPSTIDAYLSCEAWSGMGEDERDIVHESARRADAATGVLPLDGPEAAVVRRMVASELFAEWAGEACEAVRLRPFFLQHLLRQAPAQHADARAGADAAQQQPAEPAPSAAKPPVEIRTFGKPRLLVKGVASPPRGKVQERPLALLRMLLIAGEDGVGADSLAPKLWPDSEVARQSLTVAIYRLRLLLGFKSAVLVKEGRVSMNPEVVWSDVVAMDCLCAEIESKAAHAAPEELSALTSRLLDLYRGSMFEDKEDGLLVAARNRWSERFLSVATMLGARLEALESWQDAEALYLRAIEAEPLGETFYRGLMRCAAARHDPAAAWGIYRRCREVLSVLLGRSPSPETQRLLATLSTVAKTAV